MSAAAAAIFEAAGLEAGRLDDGEVDAAEVDFDGGPVPVDFVSAAPVPAAAEGLTAIAAATIESPEAPATHSVPAATFCSIGFVVHITNDWGVTHLSVPSVTPEQVVFAAPGAA